jgi:hypothetical protein
MRSSPASREEHQIGGGVRIDVLGGVSKEGPCIVRSVNAIVYNYAIGLQCGATTQPAGIKAIDFTMSGGSPIPTGIRFPFSLGDIKGILQGITMTGLGKFSSHHMVTVTITVNGHTIATSLLLLLIMFLCIRVLGVRG